MNVFLSTQMFQIFPKLLMQNFFPPDRSHYLHICLTVQETRKPQQELRKNCPDRIGPRHLHHQHRSLPEDHLLLLHPHPPLPLPREDHLVLAPSRAFQPESKILTDCLCISTVIKNITFFASHIALYILDIK